MSHNQKSLQKHRQEKIRSEFKLRQVQEVKKKLTTQKEEAAGNFCKNLRYLMNCLYLKNKRDDDILQMQERVRIATTSNPISVIETAGPYFFKYRMQLARRNMDFFKKQDFTEDIAEAAKNNNSDVDSTYTPEVVTKMRETWDQYTNAEHNVMLQKAIEMLGHVASYTKADKALKALREKQRAAKK